MQPFRLADFKVYLKYQYLFYHTIANIKSARRSTGIATLPVDVVVVDVVLQSVIIYCMTWDIGSINRGKSLSQETKLKISTSLKGRKSWNQGKKWNNKVKQQISESRKGYQAWNKNRPWTKAERKAISEGRKGIVAWNLGIARTAEEKEKMRLAAVKMWERRRSGK